MGMGFGEFLFNLVLAVFIAYQLYAIGRTYWWVLTVLTSLLVALCTVVLVYSLVPGETRSVPKVAITAAGGGAMLGILLSKSAREWQGRPPREARS